jgi:glycosyltransferase involved in cell wall biosynthesis
METIEPPLEFREEDGERESAVGHLREALLAGADRRFADPAAGSVSVVIPAFNEGGTIAAVVARARAALDTIGPRWSEVLVVDDGSSDGTAASAESAGALVVSHAYNVGNGGSVKTGIRKSRGAAILLLDADGQHDPAEMETLLRGLARHDMMVGARAPSGHAALHRRFANAFLARFASYVAGRKIPDLTSGFRAMRRETAERFLFLLPNRFSYPTTLTLSCLRSGRTVGYVPIAARRREKSGAKSKIRPLDDGVRFCLIILKIATFHSPLRIFFPLAFAIFSIGLGYYFYTYWTAHRFTNFSLLLLVLAAITFALGLISEQIASLRFERTEDRR